MGEPRLRSAVFIDAARGSRRGKMPRCAGCFVISSRSCRCCRWCFAWGMLWVLGGRALSFYHAPTAIYCASDGVPTSITINSRCLYLSSRTGVFTSRRDGCSVSRNRPRSRIHAANVPDSQRGKLRDGRNPSMASDPWMCIGRVAWATAKETRRVLALPVATTSAQPPSVARNVGRFGRADRRDWRPGRSSLHCWAWNRFSQCQFRLEEETQCR